MPAGRGRHVIRLTLLLGVAVSGACRPLQPLHPVPVAAPAAASPSVPRGADRATEPAAGAVVPASRQQVVETAAAVFGDSAALLDVPVAEPEWDLDVRTYETHERVTHYVNLFGSTARERTAARLSRGTRYEPMIRAKLRANGMPEDLTYLALIESGYDPHAYSRAAAVGMWQFMSSTARDIGMRVDWWMDERRDPARATDGAIRFLGYLQRQFGSLYLAAAAYNGGPGRVSRGLSRFAEELEGAEGEDRFFALAEQDYLRAETKNYVPQLIAAALVGKRPAQYGLRVDTLPAYVYDSVQVEPGTSLAAVADAGGIPHADLRDLNPALLRGVTPPDAKVWVRVPVGSAEPTAAALDTLDADARRGFTMAKVTDAISTPTTFARRHGITLTQLRWFNPTMRTSRKGRLVSGQSLRIPRDHALRFAQVIPDPAIEKYGSATAGSRTAGGSAAVHVVRRGETLGGIARRYGLTEARLRALNGMRGSRIKAGQKLVVRGSRTVSTTTSAAASKTTPATKAPATKAPATKAPATKAPAKKATAKKATAKKATAKKATAKKKATGRRSPVASSKAKR
jgi:membrane-bound lytic murein transglycosylase D